jgi:hypothetical protein
MDGREPANSQDNGEGTPSRVVRWTVLEEQRRIESRATSMYSRVMKRSLVDGMLVLVAAISSSCGRPMGPPNLKLKGTIPYTSRHPNDRALEYTCPGCGGVLQQDQKVCQRVLPDRSKCGAQIVQPKEFGCPNCQNTGKCSACIMMGQTDGRCYYCGGSGYSAANVECANCDTSQKCPVCKGSQQCDLCGGDGKMTPDEAKKWFKSSEPEDKSEEGG